MPDRIIQSTSKFKLFQSLKVIRFKRFFKCHISVHFLAVDSDSFSKLLSDSWFLVDVSICPPLTLNSRSTAAEDGSVVLNLANAVFTAGYLFSIAKQRSGSAR